MKMRIKEIALKILVLVGVSMTFGSCFYYNSVVMKPFQEVNMETSLASLSPAFLEEMEKKIAQAKTPEEKLHLEWELHQKAYRYPSAALCQKCHPQHYDQWAVSQHAYAQISPIFLSMHGATVTLTNGTNGDFCIRCHNPLGIEHGESVFNDPMKLNPISLEGITCVVCHRLNKEYGKQSGRLKYEKGDVFQPIYGPLGNDILKRVIDDPDSDVTTQANSAGEKIHTQAKKSAFLEASAFCATCHDVNLVNGFRLEEAFSEYKNSPAAAKKISCQDCHMGKIQGKFLEEGNYEYGFASSLAKDPKKDRRKITSHFFAGPDYSILHPGIFPHNPEAKKIASAEDWLCFDFKSEWGKKEYEEALVGMDSSKLFPLAWQDSTRRQKARKVIDKQMSLLHYAERQRRIVLQEGFVLGDVQVHEPQGEKISFTVDILNGTDGHGVPTGFSAERITFLEVTVYDREGKIVFQSGDKDPNGDLRNAHSLYVHNGELPRDPYLLSLQSKFITRSIRGGEKEQVLPINFSTDPLPFLRPATTPNILTGRPGGVRIHKKNILPGDKRQAYYEFEGKKGPFRARLRLIAGMVPPHLINVIKVVGFSYNLSAREVSDLVVKGYMTIWERELVLEPGKYPKDDRYKTPHRPEEEWPLQFRDSWKD